MDNREEEFKKHLIKFADYHYLYKNKENFKPILLVKKIIDSFQES